MGLGQFATVVELRIPCVYAWGVSSPETPLHGLRWRTRAVDVQVYAEYGQGMETAGRQESRPDEDGRR